MTEPIVAQFQPPRLDLEILTGCAYRDQIYRACRAVLDRRRELPGWDQQQLLIEAIVRDMVSVLTSSHDAHAPVTQFYATETRRLRDELRLKDLVIQQLGQAVAQQCSLDETCGCLACVRERVAEREMAGAR